MSCSFLLIGAWFSQGNFIEQMLNLAGFVNEMSRLRIRLLMKTLAVLVQWFETFKISRKSVIHRQSKIGLRILGRQPLNRFSGNCTLLNANVCVFVEIFDTQNWKNIRC